MNGNQLILALTAASAVTAYGMKSPWEERGVKVLNDRLTLRPYVALSYTYDSNVDSGHRARSGSQWVVNPGVTFGYADARWEVEGAVWYQYHAYNRYTSSLNMSSYGESLAVRWANSEPFEKGWRLRLSEKVEQISQDDDMTNHNGRGLGRDRMQVNLAAAVERRINQWLHADVTADYYYLYYNNDSTKYAPLYGWSRVSFGGQVGYTASRWLDLLLAGSYQHYWQENDSDREAYYNENERRGRRISANSKGWSLMAGFGSYATEKIQYRALAGWTRFEYGGASTLDGWTYQLSANWQVDAENTLNLSILGSSYYQPSEREYGSALKVYNLSVGARKSLVRNTLHATADLAYRKEAREYAEREDSGYDEDIWTARLGLVYDINRIFSVYGRIEWQTERTRNGRGIGRAYDYDRWRGTVGVRMTY